MTEEIKKYIRDEARLLENVGDSFEVILGNNKGLFIQLDNSCGDIEYFIELNDIEEDGSWEACASYNQTSVFGDVDKLILIIENYLDDVL